MKFLRSIYNYLILQTIPHKVVVFYYCLRFAWRFKCPILLWRGLIHDWQKLALLEVIYYSYEFGKVYVEDELTKAMKEGFIRAWHHHLRFGPHHWQHWLLYSDASIVKPVRMPNSYVYEMVCDWIAMGIGHKDLLECRDYYAAQKNIMLLHPETRRLVESLINDY